jgi:hypothetical protein
MKNKKSVQFLVFIILIFLNVGTGQASCQIDKACVEFEDFSYSCREKKIQTDCSKFVTKFKSLLTKGNCKRSFDTKPVFDVWYCSGIKGAAALDLHYLTLALLKSKEALALYSSKQLRDTMDGAIAEEHNAKSVKLEKTLNKKTKK